MPPRVNATIPYAEISALTIDQVSEYLNGQPINFDKAAFPVHAAALKRVKAHLAPSDSQARKVATQRQHSKPHAPKWQGMICVALVLDGLPRWPRKEILSLYIAAREYETKLFCNQLTSNQVKPDVITAEAGFYKSAERIAGRCASISLLVMVMSLGQDLGGNPALQPIDAPSATSQTSRSLNTPHRHNNWGFSA